MPRVRKESRQTLLRVCGVSKGCHDSITQIASKISSEKFTEYFKFGFVRNPWDRAVSLYEREKGRPNENKQFTLGTHSENYFEEFIEWMNYASSTCIHSQPHRYQLDWFVNHSGEILVDFIGRYKRLEQDWATVANKLGIDTPIPWKNKSEEKRHYTEYYNRKTRDIIATRFAVDIDYFEYEFGK